MGSPVATDNTCFVNPGDFDKLATTGETVTTMGTEGPGVTLSMPTELFSKTSSAEEYVATIASRESLPAYSYW